MFYEFVVDYEKKGEMGHLNFPVGGRLGFDWSFLRAKMLTQTGCKPVLHTSYSGCKPLHGEHTTRVSDGVFPGAYIAQFCPLSWRLEAACPHIKVGESRGSGKRLSEGHRWTQGVDAAGQSRRDSYSWPHPLLPYHPDPHQT